MDAGVAAQGTHSHTGPAAALPVYVCCPPWYRLPLQIEEWTETLEGRKRRGEVRVDRKTGQVGSTQAAISARHAGPVCGTPRSVSMLHQPTAAPCRRLA